MKERKVTIPELMLIAVTRLMLGIGVGLLLAKLFNDTQRVSIGWTLTAVGVVLTVPLLMEVFGKK